MILSLLQDFLGWILATWITNQLPPEPDELQVDTDDPESVAYGAAVLDQAGEWVRARELYEHLQQKWPTEFGEYARNCISSIDKRQVLQPPEN